MRLPALLLLMLCSVGCVEVEVMRYSAAVYPPKADAEVLDTKPARPYEVIAMMNIEEEEDAILKLRKRAGEIGADAIILMRPRAEGTFVTSSRMSPQVSVVHVIDCEAIRYKDQP
jgi:hypothetical protein